MQAFLVMNFPPRKVIQAFEYRTPLTVFVGMPHLQLLLHRYSRFPPYGIRFHLPTAATSALGILIMIYNLRLVLQIVLNRLLAFDSDAFFECCPVLFSAGWSSDFDRAIGKPWANC